MEAFATSRLPEEILERAPKLISISARLLILLLIASGCGPSLKVVKNNFYDYGALSAELVTSQKV